MEQQRTPRIDKILVPFQHFIHQEKSGSIVLGICVIIALILANSPLEHWYHELLELPIGLTINNQTYFNFTIHHWINDGLMSIFFFLVGLELKREFIGGELKNPKNALSPIVAAIGGMLVPALVYFFFNRTGEASNGWGIPMATDIAFALGVLFLLGKRIPLSLKVFLTALAIVDDLGAVLVIAFFYSSNISIEMLLWGFGFFGVMLLANKLGVRKTFIFALIGIGGVWIFFLLSGVHATIAAVLAAFAIPAQVKYKEQTFIKQTKEHLDNFENIDPNDQVPVLTNEQIYELEGIQQSLNAALPPSQKLEHQLHPWVSFIILPLFALANAGINLSLDFDTLFSTNILWGVSLGLIIGKPLGIFCATYLLNKFKIAPYPQGMNNRNLLGLGLLAGIGFTMSIFVTTLAFSDPIAVTQAKVGILIASLLSGILGYLILKKNAPK